MRQPTPPPSSSSPRQETGSTEGANEFTGERPGWGEGFDYDYARHVAAYEIAEQMIGGKTVLDAGCGEGFGTQRLAASATQVVGVDYSGDAIRACRRLWKAANLRFEQVDLTDPASFTERFDVVLSFQVIEHIRETAPFIRALRDRLLPGGMLVLTTPNRLRTVSENPFHVREYIAEELRAELAAAFEHVTIRGIHGNEKVEQFEEGRARAVARILRLDPLGIRNLLPRPLVEFAFARLARLVRRRARPAGAPSIVPEDFCLRDDARRALDLVAICRAPHPAR